MGYVVTLAQQKGGAGKTTLLAHLAHAWAAAGKTVAVVDLDPQSSLSQWLSLSDLPLDQIETKDYRAGGDIKSAAREADYVLVDCPGSATTMLEAALRESDLVLVPCQPTAMDAWATGKILEMAGKAKVPSRIVLNRVPPRGGAVEDTKARVKESGGTVLKSSLGNRVAFANGIARGTTALGLARRSTAVDEVMALRKELDRVLKSL
ncbi:MAG: ParA family partition ATPase [Pseudomonadota bacterium]